MKNMLFTILSTFLGILFFEIASIEINKILPPSKAGIGNKFIIPMFTLKKAMKPNKAMNPA
jgi:hypothetical protein